MKKALCTGSVFVVLIAAFIGFIYCVFQYTEVALEIILGATFLFIAFVLFMWAIGICDWLRSKWG